MDWTPTSELIEQYRQQIGVINQKILKIQSHKVEDGILDGSRNIEMLCTMRNSLMYSIHLMNGYINKREE